MKRLAEQTLYEILEVASDAQASEIERAYERARALYGPGSLATYTLMSSEEAAHLNARIEEAGAVLLDPAARSRYDESIVPQCRAEAGGKDVHVHGANGVPRLPWKVLPPVIPAAAQRASEDGGEKSPRAEPEAAAALQREDGAAPAERQAAPPMPAIGSSAAEAPHAEGATTATAPGAGTAAAPAEPRAGEPPPARAEPARAPILLDRPVDAPLPQHAPKEVVVAECAAWTGEMIRRVREARGLTVGQISERTKVTRYHLENIEEERFSRLPAPVYLRGILMSMARELRLDGQKVARSYLDRVAAATGGGAPPGDPAGR